MTNGPARFFETNDGTLLNIDKVGAMHPNGYTDMMVHLEGQIFVLSLDEADELRSLMMIVREMPDEEDS